MGSRRWVAQAAPLDLVQQVTGLWQGLAMQAAEVTLRAIERQTGLKDLALRDVPIDSLQVFVGRQHALAVELDGKQFELTLQPTPPAKEAAPSAPGAGPLAALPMPKELSSTALAEFNPWQWQAQHLALPEVTLAGPVELVFARSTDLSLFLPHSADVPRARRLLVAPGCSLTLRQLRGISLRKPLELPSLPASYLADVYAHAKLGEPEPGFHNSPGMLYLAGELYRQATNASLGLVGSGGGVTQQLLSFLVEPAGASVTVTAARLPGEAAPLRLRLRKQPGGVLELGLRDAEEAAAADAAARAAAAPGGVAPGALALQSWAWPLPLVGLADWVPYESLLRSILAASNMKKGLQQGLALRLTRSSVKGVRLLHFEMELNAPPLPGAGFVAADAKLLGSDDIEGGRESLEVWEALVEVREKPGGDGAAFVPVSVKRKHAYTSTLTLSPSALALALGAGSNASRPLGTESSESGAARAAAASRDEL